MSQSGSKTRMYERIIRSHRQSLSRSEAEVAMELFKSEQQEPSLAEAPRQPSARERELHEATHIPYRAWCPFCVSTRARGDYHSGSSSPEELAQREHPTIQADFFYCEERKDDTKCVLILVDCWTKFVHAEPIKIRNRRSVGESMSLFIGRLGHAGTVELCVDNENVIKAGAEHCRDCRLRMGFQTILNVNKQYDKARTSTAERMIQSIRNLGKTLVAQLESEAKVRLPSGHCLRYWAVVHAGGLIADTMYTHF